MSQGAPQLGFTGIPPTTKVAVLIGVALVVFGVVAMQLWGQFAFLLSTIVLYGLSILSYTLTVGRSSADTVASLQVERAAARVQDSPGKSQPAWDLARA